MDKDRFDDDTANKGGRTINAIDKALIVAQTAQERKAFNLTVLDLDGRCSYADALVIASATSDRHAVAVLEAIVDAVRNQKFGPILSSENGGGWSIVDLGDVVAHVFTEETRAYYDLDQLWSNAPRVTVPAAPVSSSPENEGKDGARADRLLRVG